MDLPIIPMETMETMDLPWIYHGFTMDLPIIPMETMDLPWIYHGFTYYFNGKS